MNHLKKIVRSCAQIHAVSSVLNTRQHADSRRVSKRVCKGKLNLRRFKNANSDLFKWNYRHPLTSPLCHSLAPISFDAPSHLPNRIETSLAAGILNSIVRRIFPFSLLTHETPFSSYLRGGLLHLPLKCLVRSRVPELECQTGAD